MSETPITPLGHIRVLDFSRVLAGPFTSQILADFGAEVIKIENPDGGDDTRAWGPPFLNGESAYFLSANRGKKSVTMNLKEEKSRKLVLNLITKSDVILENFRPGTMDRLGFGYPSVAQMNPKIIYCSISGYGQTGPFKDKPGYDLVAQGMSGVMALTGETDGSPFKVGTSIADLVAGLYAMQGILLALVARERTGKGQRVDVSLLDGLVSLLSYQAGIYFATGQAPTRRGNQHPTICPYETLKASDGYFNVAVGNEKLWALFCKLIGEEALASDDRFKTNSDRVKNRPALLKILDGVLIKKKVQEWMTLFDKNGIPGGPILPLNEALTHPHVLAREMVLEGDHKKAGKIKMLGVPVKLSDTPARPDGVPPLLGEHTDEIFKKYSD
ncbi:MAG TPA: CoA transferase [Elusimicrobiota bacterium]|nr:CoA transferase [Elusimicrobiota bacterium]